MILLFSLALLASDPSAASTPAPPAAVPAKVKQKLICKDDDADSGSHMVRRTCRTADEWNRLPQLGTSRSGVSVSGDAMKSQ